MPVKSASYKAPAGGNYISSPDLLNVEILSVKRTGVGHTRSDVEPVGYERKYQYIPGDGKIVFSPAQPFAGPPVTVSDDVYEYIFVMYKY